MEKYTDDMHLIFGGTIEYFGKKDSARFLCVACLSDQKVFCIEKTCSADPNPTYYFIEPGDARYTGTQLCPYDGLYDKELCERYGIQIAGLYTKSFNIQKRDVLSEIKKDYEKYLNENFKDN